MNRKGIVDVESLAGMVDASTLVVSVMLANNEIGTIQPLGEVAKITRPVGALLHTDAAQALGRIRVNVKALGVDLLSASAHKMHGPKGIGALYVRSGPNLGGCLKPLWEGGGQQRGLRAGTLPTPLVEGFGVACQLARKRLADDAQRIGAMRDRPAGPTERRVR